MKLTPEQIAEIKGRWEKGAEVSDDIPTLLAHIEVVEAERDSVASYHVFERLNSRACKAHRKELKSRPFANFECKTDDLGCVYCLKAERDAIAASAIELLISDACEAHHEEIKSMSFGDFVCKAGDLGCVYCLKAERDALRTALEEVVCALKGHHKNKDYESIYSADAEDIAFQALRSKESETK